MKKIGKALGLLSLILVLVTIPFLGSSGVTSKHLVFMAGILSFFSIALGVIGKKSHEDATIEATALVFAFIPALAMWGMT